MSSDLACYTFTPPQTGPFSLVIPPTTYCAGSDVEGEVLLKFPQVQDEQIDEVIVELRGKLKVSVLVLHSGGQRVASVERQELVFLKQSLWKRGSAYPPPGSHVVRLPFRFHLPSDPKILPSVCWDQAVITYYVEAIALRPRAFFTSDKRVRKGLAVVSRGDPTLCASIRSLGEVQAQGGPTWKTVHREKRVRRGIWGEHSTARVEVRLTFRLPPHGEMPVRPSPSLTAAPPSCTVPQLLIPNQHGILPRCLDVPILIKIKTTTARLARAKADRHPEGEPIFPSLGLESDSNNNNSDSTVDVRMRQTFTVRVGGITDSRTTEIVLLHIKQHDLLPSSSSSSSYYLQWEDDVRAGDREMMGRWVQRWTLQPTVKLGRFPPTFECDSVDCAYTMRVEVPFPGMGNSIHVSMPVTLDSGIDQAVPIKGGGTRAARQRQVATTTTTTTDTSSGGGIEVPRDVEPPNLPPTYFDAVYRDGEVVSEGDGVRDTGTHPPRYNDQG